MKTVSHRILSSSPEETVALGVLLGKHLTAGMAVALNGELGSGKTCLVQGIARGLEVPKGLYVTSPSYSLINEYPGRLRLFHVDLYRLDDFGELEDLGLEEFLGADGVTVVEWAEKMAGTLPDERLSVSISIVTGQTRAIVLTGYGPEAVGLVGRCVNE
ncbi:MAG: tRNA (adenosine(37)-N6)-threonylcarbamoyltransferase complex ATPase subunit type 1 TsaE [Thermodesulfobacteriota bacterium]|nr:tRNA (adenosine(37)-N6)-threonylcarbamoyltransferase complex ATPase subunit type 1 TsaE [Thermodesulfobacteriota bacterium]